MSFFPSVRGSVGPSSPARLCDTSAAASASSENDECDRVLLADNERGGFTGAVASSSHSWSAGKRSSVGVLSGLRSVGSVRCWAVALTGCALCLLLLAGSRRVLQLRGTGGAARASLLYSGRGVSDWRLPSNPAVLTTPVGVRPLSHSASAQSLFPPLSALLSSRTASPSAAASGLSSFTRCVSASSSPPRVAVVSSRSSHPTAGMLSVASLESGWCVVVLAELGGAAWVEWTSEVSRAAALLHYDRTLSSLALSNRSSLQPSAFSRLSYIDQVEQASLPYSVSQLVSSGSASVRHVGYVLAMHAGASAILDLHEHTVYTDGRDLPYERQSAHFLSALPFARNVRVRTGNAGVDVSVLNPYPLYGQVDSWPRGLPVGWLGVTLPATALSVDGVCLMNSSQPHAARRLCRPVVQHFLAGHYADVDGVYVAVSSSSHRLPLDFLAPAGRHIKQHAARSTPAVSVPRGTYTPFNARSTLFLPDAYAALVMPSNTLQHMADIARAYITQTLLTYNTQQLHDHCIVIAPPHFAHVDHSSNTATASQEVAVIASMERLLTWLTLRQKGGSRQMAIQSPLPQPSEILQWLYEGLHEAGELGEDDVTLVRAWLSDVSRAAYLSIAPQGQSGTTVDDAAIASTSAPSQSTGGSSNASSSDCFPSYSLPSVHLSTSSAPLNLPAQPHAVLASDGNTYSLSDYADGFLFPDKYAAGVWIDQRRLHFTDPATVKPAGRWLPYAPHRHPPKPRVDFIVRAFSGYSPLTSALLRSIDTFVPWKQLGDLIVVLDDSDADRHYATSLPDDVTVYFERKPAFFDQWGVAVQQTGLLGVERQTNGYALGLYSNWVSDRYSDADYICVLDPDMLFVSRASLPLMFDWDEQQRAYKPVWICRDRPEAIFLNSSYALFGLDQSTAPGCMYQLPVCVHRSTLKRVRLRLNDDFHRSNSTDYSKYGLNPAVDRDSEYEQYGRQYGARQAEAGSVLPAGEGGVAPAAFDRTYMRMVNRDLGHAVCQFCVWGSFILLHPTERRRYTVHLQGNKDNSSDCPQLRAATHSGYLVPQPKMSPAYYELSDRLLMEGTCHSALPTDCILPLCRARSHWYDAMHARAAGVVLQSAVLRQELLFRWESQGVFLDGPHDKRCKAYVMTAAQQLYEWTQQFDLVPQTRRDKHCPHIALTER